ncbi:metallophosphatase [Acetobacter oeni]|uniref:Metallophosphatase n=2 Tax=Acetobacter oeni TaxID=304077 RepID=A0A511XH48_9PROT|nr:DNA repair exonuclease [Acetobacter oeni]GBR00482.1 metallophosphoesterase [Acetobacter oeni LMG 21952]GEN62274.1 metallophosphatase [Acetobacter oeni]
MKVLHTADWQLGKPYGRFTPELRAALTEARFDVIDTLGKAATEHSARHILVAGDIFDTEGPEDRTIVQAVSRMERHPCHWWLLPGNHDFARNGGLWDRVRAKAGDRITILTTPEPRELEDGAWLLPAPLTHRHNLDDPTEAFDTTQTPGARLRIGLAHGSIRDFGSRGETNNQIPPDRARRASLDYLALGDWHGVLKIDARTWYAGTPETDRFQNNNSGHALLVELSPGADPVVTPLRTGRFHWLIRERTVSSAADFDADCAALLSETDAPNTLLQLTLAGITDLTDRVAILAKIENDLAHRLRFLDLRDENLVGRPTENDLAALDVEGTLGIAAQKLNALSQSAGPEARIARRALERLLVEYNREDQA